VIIIFDDEKIFLSARASCPGDYFAFFRRTSPTLEITRRTTNPRLQMMSVMKHHTTSKDILILHQLGWQDQPQSNTPSIKRSLGGRVH